MSVEAAKAQKSPDIAKLLDQYGCGPIRFAGTENALYERHLLFDRVVQPAAATPRDAFEAVAHAVRDVLAQRWMKTEATYDSQNTKRLYYLSMEFLIGRSLANNVTNLLLDPLRRQVIAGEEARLVDLLEQEPDAGLGNGGLGRLAACFIESDGDACSCRRWATDCDMSTASSSRSIQNGWQHEKPDNWLRPPDPWEVARPNEKVEVRLDCSFELSGGSLRAGARPSIDADRHPFDRPVIGYGGKTINTLRLWAAAAPDYFDFQEFSGGDFVGALAETLAAETLTRVLYPDDSTSMGQGAALHAGVLPGRLLAGGCGAPLPARQCAIGARFPEKVAIQLNDTHPALAVPELMRILLDEAQPWMGRSLGHHAANPGVHQPHPAARGAGEMAGGVVRDDAAAAPRDHLRNQSPLPGRCSAAVSRRRRSHSAHEPDRRGRPQEGPHGESGDRRLAQHQWRRSNSLRAAARDDGQRSRRDVPRAVQQQDQRRHAAALAAAGQPAARTLITDAIGDGWITDLEPA